MLMDVLHPTPPFPPPQHWLRDVMETLRLFHFLSSNLGCQIEHNTFNINAS